MNLFDDTSSLSPRAQWMQDHSIVVDQNPDGTWTAKQVLGLSETDATKDDAIASLAARLLLEDNIKPWNWK